MGCQNELQPSDFAIAPTVEKYADKYMFLQAIQHINRVKTGPFSEHSNTLWGVSGCQLWDKVGHLTVITGMISQDANFVILRYT